MLASIRRVFGQRVSSDAFDVRLGQGLCFLGALLVLIGASVWMGRLPLTEREIMLALLVSIGVAVQLVILGMVMPLASLRK